LGFAGICTLLPALILVAIFIVANAISSGRSFLRFQDLAVVTGVSATLVALTVLLNLGLFLMHKWRESSLEAERYRKENVEFRFEMLRNQVNPHFLFNSLNTLASLVYTDVDTASSFVRELARVYRYVLETGDRELTPLEKELTFLDAFI
jgi:LytS/YehU family sensor histidine kinase